MSTELLKLAREAGVIAALEDAGYSEGAIKTAIWQKTIQPGIQSISKYLSKYFGAGKAVGPGQYLKGLSEGGPFAQRAATTLQRGATGLDAGLRHFSDKPWQALGEGMIETGKGGLFLGGKGIGGTLGKGLAGTQLARMYLD